MNLLKRPRYVDRKHYLMDYHKKKIYGIAKGQAICFSPTPMAVVDHALHYIHFFRHEKVNIVEVGCGDGRWLIEAARKCDRINCVGFEMHPERARLARSLATRYRVQDRVKIITSAYSKHRAPKADYLILYMYPGVNESIVNWFSKTNKSFNVLTVSYRLEHAYGMSSKTHALNKDLVRQEIDVISMTAWAGYDVFRYHVKRG